MDTIEAIILGIVQGLTEFLPVSSSGHLQIAKALMGVEIEQNLLFDVTLHAATVLSTIVVLWSEVARLLRGLFSRRFNEEQAYVLKLLLSMIPIGIVGFTLKDRLDALLESPAILLVVGCMLLVTAALLAFAYYAKPRQKAQLSYRDAFLIGVAQAVAALPGLSRSGSTIATGLLLGNRKQTVAQFSFLMVLGSDPGRNLPGIDEGQPRRAGDRLGAAGGRFRRGLRRGVSGLQVHDRDRQTRQTRLVRALLRGGGYGVDPLLCAVRRWKVPICSG